MMNLSNCHSRPAGLGGGSQERGFSHEETDAGKRGGGRGLYEAGCSLISSYPGTPSTEITEQAAKYDEIYCEWAPTKKVAMEVAFGAALAGKRSACVMKHVGSMWPPTRSLPFLTPVSTPAWSFV